MGLLGRLGKVVSSNINAAVSKAEDPHKMMDQALLDMEEQVRTASRRRVEVAALLKTAEKRARDLVARAADVESRAQAAVTAGRDDLARKAIEEKQDVDGLLAAARAEAAQQRTMVDDLGRSIDDLQQHVAAARKRRNELEARLTVAQARQRRAEARGEGAPAKDHLGDTAAFDTFDRLGEQVERDEAGTEAARELAGGTSDAAAQLDTQAQHQATDDALAALKRKMGRS